MGPVTADRPSCPGSGQLFGSRLQFPGPPATFPLFPDCWSGPAVANRAARRPARKHAPASARRGRARVVNAVAVASLILTGLSAITSLSPGQDAGDAQGRIPTEPRTQTAGTDGPLQAPHGGCRGPGRCCYGRAVFCCCDNPRPPCLRLARTQQRRARDHSRRGRPPATKAGVREAAARRTPCLREPLSLLSKAHYSLMCHLR